MGKKKGKKKKEPDLLALQAEFTEKLLNAAFRVEEEKAIELVQELVTNEMPKIVEIAAKQDQVLDVPQMLNNRNHHGRTPLQFAAVRAHLQVIATLVTAGAGVDVPVRRCLRASWLLTAELCSVSLGKRRSTWPHIRGRMTWCRCSLIRKQTLLPR